jgi:3-phenylpropionate/cinnamic acid dioxygenase small subunit
MTGEDRLQLLLDRSEISDIVIRFAVALDIQDWPLFRSCFTDEIEADYSDFRGEPPALIRADDFVEQRQSTLSGLRTQHISSNHVITVDGDTATCISCAVIHRYDPSEQEDNCFDTHGYYYHTLIRTSEGWRICKVKQIVFWNKGKAQIHGFHRDKKSIVRNS